MYNNYVLVLHYDLCLDTWYSVDIHSKILKFECSSAGVPQTEASLPVLSMDGTVYTNCTYRESKSSLIEGNADSDHTAARDRASSSRLITNGLAHSPTMHQRVIIRFGA